MPIGIKKPPANFAEQNLKGQAEKELDTLFTAGAHFGLIRSRRHPSAKAYIFGVKNKIEIFDLEKTHGALEKAKNFIKDQVSTGGLILLVGGKNEARTATQEGALKVGMPYVAGRWLGGTLTNFTEIKKRINKLEDLTSQKEKGELGKYTKKERLLIDREIERLTRSFAGLTPMKSLPKAVFVIDPKREHIAVAEAHKMKVPVIAVASSDCNMREVEYPIPANDASTASIRHFVSEIISAISEGQGILAKSKEV
jgi:small subunit ribosomal protein S2